MLNVLSLITMELRSELSSTLTSSLSFFARCACNSYFCLRPKEELLRIHFSPKESTSAATLFCNQRIHASYFSAHSARFQSSAVVRNENLAMQNGERTI